MAGLPDLLSRDPANGDESASAAARTASADFAAVTGQILMAVHIGCGWGRACSYSQVVALVLSNMPRVLPAVGDDFADGGARG